MVKDNIITIFRGDDVELEVKFDDNYTMKAGDKLILSVRDVPLDDSALLLQVESLTTGILLPHSQTSKLEPGKYSYDVELQIAKPDGSYTTRTIIPRMSDIKHGSSSNWKNFIVNGEVTYFE